MKRKFISLLIALVILLLHAMQVSAGIVKGYSGGIRVWDLPEKYCAEQTDATVNGTVATIRDGGQVTYNFYIPINAESITFSLGQASTKFTLVDVESDLTYDINTDETTYTMDLKTTLYIGEHTFLFKADKGSSVSIACATFNKKKINVSNTNFVTTTLTDEEWAISTAIILYTDASMLMVNGSRRYINFEDPTEIPLNINDTIYLPVHTLARALGCYYEDLRDKEYVLIRKLDKEFLFSPDINYKQTFGQEREIIKSLVVYQAGIPYLPLRTIAEEFGEVIGYKDGLIAMDDNKFYVHDILEDDVINPYVMEKFRPFMITEENDYTGRTYYVAQNAVNASDENIGTADEPWATLAHAGDVVTAGDTVIVKEGIYRETLTVKNSGTATKPINFKAAEGENVVISAAEDFSGNFIKYKDNILAAHINWDLGATRNQIFYNGKTIREARYPNEPDLELAEIANLSNNWATRGDIHVYQKKDLNHAYSETLLNQDEDDYWKGGYLVGAWATVYGLQSTNIIASKKGELTLKGGSLECWATTVENSLLYGGKWNFAYIVGHMNCLDAPGEWIIRGNTLFIIPPEGETAETLKIEVKKRQLVIDITDNKYVNISGFTTIGGGAKMNNSEMCLIENCNVKYNNHFLYTADPSAGYIEDGVNKNPKGTPQRGEMGFYVGGKDNVFLNNIFDEAAGPGIYSVGLYPYFENNWIKNCGYAGGYNGGIFFSSQAWLPATTPRHGFFFYQNTCSNSGRSTFMVTSTNKDIVTRPHLPNDIGYNEFYGSMLSSLDTGITYTYMLDHGYDRLHTQMHNNLVYNNYAYQPFSFGIYHDGGTQNIDTYENLVFTTAEDITIGDYLHKAYATEGLANCDMWNNRIKDVVPGGREGLQPKNYPYNKPYDAGCTLARTGEYTVNYDLRHTDLTQEYVAEDLTLKKEDGFLPAEKAELGEGTSLGDDGLIHFKGDGSWVVFRDVDFGDGANIVDISYHADIYNLEGEDIEIIIDDLDGIAYDCAQSLTTVSKQANIGETKGRQIAAYSGYHDVYLRVKEYHTLKLTGIRVFAHNLEQGNRINNRIYCGDFDMEGYVPGLPTLPSVVKKKAIEDNEYIVGSNLYCNNTWSGSVFPYKKITITEDVDTLTFCSSSDDIFGGQWLQIRIGDRNAEPIAELFTTSTVGWGKYVEDQVALKKVLPAGTYDLYLTFDGSPTVGKSCSMLYFDFFNSKKVSIIPGRNSPRSAE